MFSALPGGVRYGDADVVAAAARDQVRLWWDTTPIDVFFAADQFHIDVAARCRVVPFEGHRIKVLSAEDLAVFTALFDRTRDWADIAEPLQARAPGSRTSPCGRQRSRLRTQPASDSIT